MSDINKATLLLHPCVGHPIGKGFGEWGEHWGYHFEPDGRWVKGKVRKNGVLMGQHGGVDILCPIGTPLEAPADGVVFQAGWQDPKDTSAGYGLRVILALHGGLLLTGGHFSELSLKPGQHVKRGEIIGLSGDTGNSTGPHSHWQLEKPGDYPREPLSFHFVEA